MSDPMDGRWERLDECAAASAQMIEWYAPETAAALRAAAIARVDAAVTEFRRIYGDNPWVDRFRATLSDSNPPHRPVGSPGG